MRKLTNEEIEYLASGNGVRKIAVENFLMCHNGKEDAYEQLEFDRSQYNWNAPTTNALLKGINAMMNDKVIKMVKR